MILDSTSKSIEVKLAGAVSANQLDLTASYVDTNDTTYTPGANDTVTNNTTAVTLVSAPASGDARHVKFLSIYNKDSASATVTVQLNSGSVRILVKVVLLTQETLMYADGVGFRCIDANANTK